MEHGSWLTGSLVYLAAAVLAVPIAKALGLGSIIGYLAAGILIGPWGLRFVTDPQDMLHFAEFGVVLMLFLVGLELEPRRLWALRQPIFGWGNVQLFGSAALMCGVAVLLGVDWRLALVAALGLAMSSTAIGLGVMAERNLMATTSGQSVLSVMLLQDVAAIPILALVPLLAASVEQAQGGGWAGAAKAVGVIALIVLGGRLLLRPALRWIARSETPEIFTAASLLLVVATAALMQAWHVAYDAIVERDGIVVKPGLFALLDWLDAEGIPKAVATSTRRDRAQAKLAQTALLDRFVALVGGDEIARGKPAPDIFLLAAQRIDHAPGTIVVFEDSEPGVRAALAAGMTPIMVPDLHPPSPDLLALEPLVVPSLAHAQAHLAPLPR